MSNPSLEPRLSMASLPDLLQPLLTWLTGMPLPDQQPLFLWNPWTRLLAGLLTTAFGVALLATASTLGGPLWMLLLPGLLLASGGLRALYLEDAHNAVHHAFTGNRTVDRLLTEILTIITLTGGYSVFRRDHVKRHHGHNGTLLDPDYAALLSWGFHPRRPLPALRRQARWAALDPRLHAKYLLARLHQNFFDGPIYRRALAVAWNGGMLAAVSMTGTWQVWTIAWLLPLTWGFQTSSALQMLGGEHRWGTDLPPGRERLIAMSFGRFLGDTYPADGWTAKAGWWSRLLLLHWPARVFVLVGNDIGPAHDVHHRKPKFDWPNAAYARRDMIARGELPGAWDEWGSLPEFVDRGMRDLAESTRTDSLASTEARPDS